MPGQRTIALPAATALVIANMVGTGVFTSAGYQVAALPALLPILLLWVVGGIASLCGAFCYAEVVAMRPQSGGEYHLLREAYHPLAGFIAGWISLVAGFAAPMALAAVAFGKYLVELGCPLDERVTGSAVIGLAVIIHLAHLGVVGRLLGGLTLLKVALILAFMIGAMLMGHRVDEPGLHAGLSDLKMVFTGGFAQSLVFVMYAYTGWNGAAYIASEVRDPRRNVPRALIAGTLVVMMLYVGVNAAFLWSTPWMAIREKPEVAVIAAKAIFGDRGGWWMGALISFGLVSMIAGLTWAGSRVNQRIGQDLAGLSILARTNKQGAPYVAVILQTALALIMLNTGSFDAVVNYVEALLLICSILAAAAVVWLRWRDPAAERPFKTPWYPLPPMVFISVAVWILVVVLQKRPQESLWGGITLLIGLAIYPWCARSSEGLQ